MENQKQELQPNLFERQVLANEKAVIVFLFVLVLFISGFNIYCAYSGRILASATLALQLFAFIVVLFAFRPPSNANRKIIAVRYVARCQLVVFSIYLIYTIGIRHQLEVTPWAFLFVFLLFLLFPNKKSGFFTFAFIALLCIAMLVTGSQVVNIQFDYLVRFFFSLTVFSILSYCTVLLRFNYLKSNEKNTMSLKESERLYRKLSNQLMEEIKQRDFIEKKLHHAIKMEAVGKMAAGVAHDLNNILSGMVTYPDLLLMDMKKNDPIREPIELIKNSGMKAAAIVEDLLTLSRKAVNISEVVDLRKIVNEYLSSPEHQTLLAQHGNIRVRTIFNPDLPNIKGSPIHLTKTVMNLICNALEAMPKGGTVSIQIEDQYIQTGTAHSGPIAEGRYTVLSVSDMGIGIEKEEMEKIFEPFYTKKVMGRSGTGLGMAVVLGAVEDHGAFINVDSEIDKGTCVTIYYPVTKDDVTLEKPEQNRVPVMGDNEAILVIDDVPEQLKIACEILERLGYDATPCKSGEEALQKIEGKQYDLMIIDMVMAPGMDGLETYKRVLETHPGQKAVFATGFSDDIKIQRAQDIGAGPCLEKPYSLERMEQIIASELGK